MPDPLTQLTTILADRYHIEGELGHGGMATVYLARDLKHDRLVAIKILRSELAHVLGPERFLREIEIAARLQHPLILPVFDSGAAAPPGDGTAQCLWYAMPFIAGESLRDRLDRERQLSVDEAVRIAGEVAQALGCATRKAWSIGTSSRRTSCSPGTRRATAARRVDVTPSLPTSALPGRSTPRLAPG